MTDETKPAADGGTPPPATPTPPETTTPPATAAPTSATKPMTNDEILAALEGQLAAVEIPTMDTEHAKKWLKDFRYPLASLTTNALIGLVQSRATGTSDAALEAALAKLKPAELNQVMKANLAALDQIKDQRVREAALLRATHQTLSSVAASFVMNGLLRVLGVPVVNAALAGKPA